MATVEKNDSRCLAAIARIREALGAKIQPAAYHICVGNGCHPTSESMAGIKEPVTNNVYVCHSGTAHVCSLNSCEHFQLYDTLTCPVTGIQYGQRQSSYSRSNYKTWKEASTSEQQPAMKKLKPEPVANARKKKITDVQVQTEAEKIVRLLLYSNNRQKCNEAVFANIQAQGRNAAEGYRRKQRKEHQHPFSSEERRLYIAHARKEKQIPFELLKEDKQRIQTYVGEVLRVWKLVVQFYMDPVDVRSVAIGVLYSMCDGFWMSDKTQLMLNCDEFLKKHLPQGEYLQPYFNIPKDIMTKGSQVVLTTFDLAYKNGSVPDSKLYALL